VERRSNDRRNWDRITGALCQPQSGVMGLGGARMNREQAAPDVGKRMREIENGHRPGLAPPARQAARSLPFAAIQDILYPGY
jgi:hypothetical protein